MVAGLLVAGVVFVVVLLWAKWLPYAARTSSLAASGAWSGSSILGVGGVQPGDPPSWQAGTSFASACVQAVWKALVAALLISAAVQSLVPRRWLLRVLNRRGRVASAVAGRPVQHAVDDVHVLHGAGGGGGHVAPVRGVDCGGTGVLVGQPPAESGGTGVPGVRGALAAEDRTDLSRLTDEEDGGAEPVGREWLADAPKRFGKALLRLSVVLVPEYLVIVLLIGAFRGWLFPVGATLGSGVLVVVLAAVVGTLLVIPTAGEIPILQGLALAGVALGPIGALLVTLPAVSLPGVAMVGRALGWRTTALTAAMVAVGGLLGAGLLAVL
jgi:uncharacterized membrane protein YraQ (UPF0718 family)